MSYSKCVYIYIYIYIYIGRERSLRPVVICPYLCSSEITKTLGFGGFDSS